MTTSHQVSDDAALEAFYGALSDDDAEALYERAPCGYLSTTPDGTIVKANETFLTWTGYRREDLVGRRRFPDLLTAGGRIYFETHYAPMLQMQGRAREIALDIVSADGRRLPALVSSVLENGADGMPVVRAAVFDATHRRQYERELLEAKRRAEESEATARLLSRTLQQMLVPPSPPRIAGLDIAGAYRPAGTGDEVGGDFYDVFERGEDDWVVAVGDVQGKGAEAAVLTALVRSSIRAAAVRMALPSQVLAAASEALVRNGSERFCSVALVRLHRPRSSHGSPGWVATVSSGGHPLPVLVEAGGSMQDIGRPGPLLGLFDYAPFADDDVPLEPGQAVVLFTDGVTEGRQDADWFGEEGLAETVARCGSSAAALVDGILGDVLAFQAGFPRDDIALVAVRVPYGQAVSETGNPTIPDDDENESAEPSQDMAEDNPDVDDE